MKRSMKAALLAVAVAALALAGHRHARQIYHAAQAAASPTTNSAGGSAAGAKPIDPAIVPPTRIGMNLAPLDYWTTEEIFYEPLKNHGWMTIGDPGVDLKDRVKRDADGWPLDMPAGTRLGIWAGTARALIAPLSCTVSPGWRVDGALSGAVVQDGTRFTLSLKSGWTSTDTVLLFLTATRSGASLTELSCQPRDVPAGALFRADFLNDIKPFRILRFMDWMKANYEPPGTWAMRPTPRRVSPLETGMPVETMVALANANHSDPWFAMPFHADDDYQRRFATYVRDHLDPGLKAYVELSNEVWNSGFPQSREATTLGKARYPSASDAQANDYYYGDRVRGMMAIWTDVFAGRRQRLVRVLSDMAAWQQRADDALGHGETWRSVDALAVAPYFGDVPNDIPGKGRERVEGILAKTPAYIDTAIGWAKANKLVASRYGLKLIAYEGGPGLNAFEPQMVRDVRDAAHDPRFHDLYLRFLERWRREIGGELVLFDSTMDGVWGHLDRTGQPLSEAPKMRAVVDFVARLPPSGGGR